MKVTTGARRSKSRSLQGSGPKSGLPHNLYGDKNDDSVVMVVFIMNDKNMEKDVGDDEGSV